MEPTTGLILRRITQTDLSVSAHKLATVILVRTAVQNSSTVAAG